MVANDNFNISQDKFESPDFPLLKFPDSMKMFYSLTLSFMSRSEIFPYNFNFLSVQNFPIDNSIFMEIFLPKWGNDFQALTIVYILPDTED